jgi:nicotinamidase/pyrazinamidase
MTKKKGLLKRIIIGIVGTIVLFIIVLIGNLVLFEKNASIVSEGQAIENFDERNFALLVIDIQEATTGEISTNSFYMKNSDELINNINRISDSCKNQNIPIVLIRSEIINPLINILNDSYAKGSLGARFDKRLYIGSGIEVVKRRNDAFFNSNLDSILTTNKINELYIVGLDAAQCINITVEAARNRNYRVNLIDEAILSESVEMKDSMIVSFRDRGVNILMIDDLKISK